MLTINTLNMGKVEVKRIPKQLNPYGDKLMKIWYDDDMPPKNYIWYKDEEYRYWNGIAWEPFELGVVEPKYNKHDKHDHRCCCDDDIKFEKFKKDTLAAVLKLIKSQNLDEYAKLAERVQELEHDVNELKQINHDLFIKNTELEWLLEELGYIKQEDIADLDILSGLDNRLEILESGIRTNGENIVNIDTRLNAVENTMSTVGELSSRVTILENAGYITASSLNQYATKNYVTEAISNIEIPTRVSQLENDKGYVSGIDVSTHDDEYSWQDDL